jgi:hypothetical protein
MFQEHSGAWESVQLRDEKKNRKRGTICKAHRPRFCRGTFCLQIKRDFGSVNLNFKTGTMSQSLNLCTGGEPPAKILAGMPSFWRIPKQTLPRIAHAPSEEAMFVFITAGPIIKLCARGGRGTVEDM